MGVRTAHKVTGDKEVRGDRKFGIQQRENQSFRVMIPLVQQIDFVEQDAL